MISHAMRNLVFLGCIALDTCLPMCMWALIYGGKILTELLNVDLLASRLTELGISITKKHPSKQRWMAHWVPAWEPRPRIFRGFHAVHGRGPDRI